MSFGSFYILFTKWVEQSKIMRQGRELRASFWRAPSLRDGAAKLEKNSAWRQVVDDGLAAEEQHGKMHDATDAHDWLHGSLARSEASINARLASGLPFLATVGATSPFIGLFGTVVGIYRALIAIGVSGSASIDKVAGPVGEALIMTALGLLVAVPAVLAYNYLQARNKRIAEELTGFRHRCAGEHQFQGRGEARVGDSCGCRQACGSSGQGLSAKDRIPAARKPRLQAAVSRERVPGCGMRVRRLLPEQMLG